MLNLRIPDRVIESMSPTEIGAYMRELREEFTLSLQDVSDRLRIRVRYLEAIEEAALSKLPAKVYARGYVQCYAEFLGLDPKQVLECCFGETRPEEPVVAQILTLTPPSKQTIEWRAGLALFAVIAVLVLLLAQWRAHQGAVKPASVPDVPEAMLVAMRTMAMPNPQNYDCFAESDALSCLESSQAWRFLDDLQREQSLANAAPDAAPAPVAEIAPEEAPAATPVDAAPAPSDEDFSMSPEFQPFALDSKKEETKPTPAKRDASSAHKKAAPVKKAKKSPAHPKKHEGEGAAEKFDPNALPPELLR